MESSGNRVGDDELQEFLVEAEELLDQAEAGLLKLEAQEGARNAAAQ